MTSPPPVTLAEASPPVEAQPGRAPHRDLRLRRTAWWLSWLAIWVMTAVQAFVWYRPPVREGQFTGERATALEVGIRNAIALKQAFPKETYSTKDALELLGATERWAKMSEAERVRMAIGDGEMFGAKAAVRSLERLRDARPSRGGMRSPAPAGRPVAREDLLALDMIYDGSGKYLTERDRERLVERFGYFGRLALAFGKPDSDPVRARVLAGALRTRTALDVWKAIRWFQFIGGGILLVVLLVAGWRRRAKGAFGARSDAVLAIDGQPFLEAFAIGTAGFLALPVLIRLIGGDGRGWWEGLSLLCLPIAWFWPRLRGVGFSTASTALGWVAGWWRPRRLLREAAWGVVGYLAGAPLVMLAGYVSRTLAEATESRSSHPIEFQLGDERLVVLALGACVIAPILEETMFRGALFHHLRRGWGWVPAALLTGFLFAVVHPQGWTAVPVLAGVGGSFAAMRYWRGSLVAPIVAHALNNAVSLGFSYAVHG